MKALTEKWNVVNKVALELGLSQDTIRKWKEPARGIPARWYLPLIKESKRKLTMADFEESEDS